MLPLPTAGDEERRALLHARIRTPAGSLPFFVTHLNWKFHDGVAREAQVVSIAEHVMREAPIERGLALAFGPGLAAEGLRFRSAA